MSVADATADFGIEDHRLADRSDRAFLGHPKGLGYLSFIEACERFSYYSMQTLLTLYMVNYLLVGERMNGVIGLDWLRSWHYQGLEGQPLSSAIFGDYTSLVYLTPIFGGIIADRFSGRRVALFAGGLVMSIGHFLMAIEGAFLFALLALIVGVGLFKGNIASQVGALYRPGDLRRAMAFQIFYIAINVSVILAPLISGTLGEEVGWHYGFGTAGIVMVIGVLIFLKGRKHLPVEEGRTASIGLGTTLRTMAVAVAVTAIVVGITLAAGILFALAALIPLYFILTHRLAGKEKARVLALILLIPVMAVALLTNQQIFNAYLIWGDQQFDLTFFGVTLPTTWLVTIDASLSFGMLVAVAAFWAFWGRKRREPDELTKIIIGSAFSVAGGLCLVAAAAFQAPGEKIGLFWPAMFHLLNSIGFAHLLPISLALFSRLAPAAIASTVIGLYYLSFFLANKMTGMIGEWFTTMDTTQFWLLHVGSALAAGLVFLLYKAVLGKYLLQSEEPAPDPLR